VKRAQRTDLIREMRKSFNRYISILLIMALGVAFYAGVRSAEPDMQLSAKRHFDETNYMDIRVLGTLGVTEDDVVQIAKIEGISEVEGGYQTELFLLAEERNYQMTVMSLGEKINHVAVTEGRIPEAADECFVDEDFLKNMGYAIGDVITMEPEKDVEVSDVLSVNTFTIVGYGKFPSYLSWQRGAVSIGTGAEDGFVFLHKDAFAYEVFTVIYATVEGAKEYNPYSEEYEDYIETVVERIEAIADVRCEIRYEEAVGPYWEDVREAEAEIADAEQKILDGEQEIADAEIEIADAEKEIADAEKKIADGEKEIADAEIEIADAQKEILDGEQKIADGEKELADAKTEIEDGEKKLADAEKELADALKEITDAERKIDEGEHDLADAWAEILDAEQQIADGEKELADAWAEILDAEQQIADGEKELADVRTKILDGEQQLADAEKELADALAEIEDGERQMAEAEEELADALAEIEDGEAQIEAGEWELGEALQQLEEGEAELAAGEQTLAANRAQLEAAAAQIAAQEAQLVQGEEQLAQAKAQLEAMGLPMTPELLEQEAILVAARTQLETAKAELAAGYQQIAAGEAQLAAAREELAYGRAAYEEGVWELEAAREELEDGRRQYEDGLAEFEDAKAELADGRKQYEDGLAEFEDAKAELADGKKKYEDGVKELEDAKAELADGRKQYEDGVKELEDAKAELADGKKKYEDGVKELEDAKAELADGKKKYEDGLKEVEEAKAELADGRKKYEDGVKELEDAKAELADGKKKYEDGLKELEDAKIELADGKRELEDGKKELEDGKKELEDAKIELADGKKELEDGKLELADAKAELEDIEMPEWYVLDRNTVQQFVEFGSNAERIGNLGDVFPAVFYLVAALVSLTTMTRMIEEERTQIGTMKALGYGKGAIVSKYLWYSLSATLIGGVFGVLVGSILFPWVIINAYGILYSNIPHVLTPIQWGTSLVSVLIAVVCTVVATLSSCYKELAAAPAILMRPVAPAAGKRVFLEYIKPLWNHMNFSWKATCRNLFRYKKRFFMTVFGIGGCMALLLVGFGLRDSIMEIVNNQYKNIWTYDAYLSVNDTSLAVKETEFADWLEEEMFVYSKTLDVESENSVKSANLFVPEDIVELDKFVDLKNRISKETYALTEDGVIVTEKLAKMLEVSVGDTIELHVDEVTKRSVTITAITENYMLHYIYMSPKLYEEVFAEPVEYNQLYLQMKPMTEAQEEEFSRAMISYDAVDAVSYVRELQESVAIMMQALELVVVVLIVAAGMLAFIVLYNLNNINIIERRRELATLKVLGFYDGEVGSYVYRENVLLTVIGIVAGIVMGFFLHRYVILTVEVDMLMFGREIFLPSYVYSVLLTILFAVLVNFGMFFKLKKIDMVESLKSAE